jgi:putative IMPACT (imprinted ancient) family translation regulator
VTDTYRTVDGRGWAAFEIRGSEFVGHIGPARDVDEGEAFVAAIREEYDDATHNVPAYRIRADENVVAVVTRYYGGTNLGVGGLARAYSRGVKDALDDAGIVEERPHEAFTITADYDDSGTVRGILESDNVEFEADYEADVQFAVRVPEASAADLRDRIRSATSDRISFG